MRKLVITGKRAERTVRAAASGRADVITAAQDIAAFLTEKDLMGMKSELEGYDLILVPGLCKREYADVESATGAKVRLGPKHAVDLAVILDLDDLELSKKVPACILNNEKLEIRARETLAEVERAAIPEFSLGGIKVGGRSRMKVVAEVVDADLLNREDLYFSIEHYLEQGADIIDLGLSLDADIGDVKKVIDLAKTMCQIVSIDTLDPELLETGIGHGADLLLSLNSEGIRYFEENPPKRFPAAVVIPDIPGDLDGMEKNIRAARGAGFKELIADPVLKPIGDGFIDAVARYKELRDRSPNLPMLFGIGNVTELVDADSVGVNALLCGIGMELDADLLFTTEGSDKCRGSVGEVRKGAEMMVLARERKTPPKDLGIDLLTLKEKRRKGIDLDFDDVVEVVDREDDVYTEDPRGPFLIVLRGDDIVVHHGSATFRGKGARSLYTELIESGLVSRLDHAAYLGRELARAEIALKLNRGYLQEEPF